MSSNTFALYANKQELQHLPEDAAYLFGNFPWKNHPAYDHCMVLEFAESDFTEAAAIYHELWHYRHDLPSLKRSWF